MWLTHPFTTSVQCISAWKVVFNKVWQSHMSEDTVRIHGNDLADILAKQERTKSFYHPRQDLDMRVWSQAFRHFWTQFAPDVGLPTFQGNAFNVRPPKVPQAVQTPQPVRYHTKQAHFCISLATANVNSLHAGPDGHRGKLQYIRDQMKALHLLFLGIQESRTGEVCSHVDEVLRLGGGADRGHHGVELWINTAQPFAYTGKTAHFLQKQNVVVAYKDPRMILTNISHPMWRAWVVVAHAPQSGTPEQERQTWWESLNAQLQTFVRDDEVYGFIGCKCRTRTYRRLACRTSPDQSVQIH